jgi:hypothetical protein
MKTDVVQSRAVAFRRGETDVLAVYKVRCQSDLRYSTKSAICVPVRPIAAVDAIDTRR